MSDLFKEFEELEEFERSLDKDDSQRSKKIDYDKYIKALCEYAAQVLELDEQSYVILKPVYLHVTKIHSLIFNVCTQGRRYSARLEKRVSLGLRDRDKGTWEQNIKEAYDIALKRPAVGLDPKLEEIPYWKESNPNGLKMTFEYNGSTLVHNSTKVVDAQGELDDLLVIVKALKERGLE